MESMEYPTLLVDLSWTHLLKVQYVLPVLQSAQSHLENVRCFPIGKRTRCPGSYVSDIARAPGETLTCEGKVCVPMCSKPSK